MSQIELVHYVAAAAGEQLALRDGEQLIIGLPGLGHPELASTCLASNQESQQTSNNRALKLNAILLARRFYSLLRRSGKRRARNAKADRQDDDRLAVNFAGIVDAERRLPGVQS